MIPGEYFFDGPDLELNAGRTVVTLKVNNTGDRPVQIGAHYHFFEVNKALVFDRAKAYGMRPDLPSGTAVRRPRRLADEGPRGGRDRSDRLHAVHAVRRGHQARHQVVELGHGLEHAVVAAAAPRARELVRAREHGRRVHHQLERAAEHGVRRADPLRRDGLPRPPRARGR